MAKAAVGRGGPPPRRHSRLLPLLGIVVFIFVSTRIMAWLGPGEGRPASCGDGGSASTGFINPLGRARAFGTGPPVPAVDLAACMAEPNATAGRFMTTEMYLAGEATRLDLDTALLSPTRVPTADITLVVTYDMERLFMLEGLCLVWGGAISAAVYQAVDDSPDSPMKHSPLREARNRIQDVHSRVSQQGMCALDVLLFTEAVASADPHMAHLFPVNVLRNRALLVAQTDLVAVLDGDLLPQAGARARFAPGTAVGNEVAAAALQKAYRVLPAFDTADIELAYDVALGDKAAAVVAFDAGRIERFGANKSRFPQGCTDYERWKAATQPYSVVYCNRYEPWGIVHRHHTPWFDARFRGYGRNKIMYAAALNSSAFEFVIDPESFVIHRPHSISGAQNVFYKSDDRRVHSHIMAMFERQKAAGRFVPVVDETSLRCKAQLPWWAGHVQEQGEAFIPGVA